MKKLIFEFLSIILILIAFNACQKEENAEKKQTQQTSSDQTMTYNEIASNEKISCSYPYTGQSLGSSRNTQLLQPGKYFKKISRGIYQWNNYKFWVMKLSGGTVIVRSVLEDLPSGNYTVLDYCQTLGNNSIEIGPNTFAAPWDNIYYEIIIQNSAAEVSWNLYY